MACYPADPSNQPTYVVTYRAKGKVTFLYPGFSVKEATVFSILIPHGKVSLPYTLGSVKSRLLFFLYLIPHGQGSLLVLFSQKLKKIHLLNN